MIELNTISLLGFVAIAFNVLLVVKIISQPTQDNVAKALLILLTLCLSASIVSHLYRYRVAGLYLAFPHFSGFSLIATFCLGPVLYLYVRQTALYKLPWSQRFWYLHFLMAVAVAVYIWPHFTRSATEKLLAFRSQEGQKFRGYLYLMNYGQILLYIGLCWRPLNHYQHTIVNFYSDIHKITLNWLRTVCLGLALVTVLGVLTILLDSRDTSLYAVFLTASAVLTIVVVFSALQYRQPAMPIGIDAEEVKVLDKKESTGIDQVLESSKQTDQSSAKYSRSGLNEETLQISLGKLQDLMNTRQLYLEDSLSLRNLADKLNISTHHLSQLLNEQLQTNFYDYINGLRIEYAKQLLMENPDQSIIDIAFSSGYNAKSTFYKAFKNHLGCTPVAYRNRLQSNTKEITPAK